MQLVDNQKLGTYGLHKRREAMFLEKGIQVIISEWNEEGRIIAQPIIEMEANKEIIDTHIYLSNERF